MNEKRQRRSFNDEFKHQIVQLYNAGKLRSEICREYDLVPTVVDRWIKRINATGSAKECDNRTQDEQEHLFSAYSICKFKVHKGSVNEAEIPNLLNRQFNEHPEYAAVVSDLTYVRVNYKWNYIVCSLIFSTGKS